MSSRNKEHRAKKHRKQHKATPQRAKTQPDNTNATTPKGHAGKWLTILVAGIGVVASFATFVGLISLRSKFGIALRDPIQKDDETDFLFTIKNDNPYPVGDLAFYCIAEDIVTEQGHAAERFELDHIAQKWTAEALTPNATKTVRCNVAVGAGGAVKQGTISILVTGKVFGIHVRQCDTFVGVRGTSWTWLQQPCPDVDLSRYAIFHGGLLPTFYEIHRAHAALRFMGFNPLLILSRRIDSHTLPQAPHARHTRAHAARRARTRRTSTSGPLGLRSRSGHSFGPPSSCSLFGL